MRRYKTYSLLFTAFVLTIVCCSQVNAFEKFEIYIVGQVEYNQITSGILGNLQPGDTVEMIAKVDSDVFIDSPNFPTRGYPLLEENDFFFLVGESLVELQDPFPAGQTPYFVIRDNDPAVDGFFLSTNLDIPLGLPLDVTGQFTPFTNNFMVTYDGDTLDSLDIQDAIGIYDFSGLSVFNWTIDDGPFNPLGIVFQDMQIGRLIVDDCGSKLGDVNWDGVVDLLDVAPFVDAIVTNTFTCEADVNLDSSVDLLDVSVFIQLLFAG